MSAQIIVERYNPKTEKSVFEIVDIEVQEEINVLTFNFTGESLHIDFEQLEILMRRLPKLKVNYFKK